jgi:plasmid stabilization system protein ParE
LSVKYAEEALVDLTDALDHLTAYSPAAAEDFYERLIDLIRRLDEGAFEGPNERLTTGDIVQSWPLYPFRIYYQRRGSVLYVLRVYHQARAPIAKRSARRTSSPKRKR